MVCIHDVVVKDCNKKSQETHLKKSNDSGHDHLEILYTGVDYNVHLYYTISKILHSDPQLHASSTLRRFLAQLNSGVELGDEGLFEVEPSTRFWEAKLVFGDWTKQHIRRIDCLTILKGKIRDYS